MIQLRRGGREVEGARLESVYRGNSIMGSNPILSAIKLARFFRVYLKNLSFSGEDKSAFSLKNVIINSFQ